MERWYRLAPLAGLVFVALLIVATLLGGNPPDPNAAGTKVIAYYHSHRTRQEVAAYLIGLSLFFGLLFYGYLRTYLRSVPETAPLAALAFGGAVLFAAGGGVFAGAQFALADVPTHLDASSAQALNLVERDLSIFLQTAGIGVLMFAAGLAIVRSRLLPAWVGWFGIVFGIVSITPAAFIAFPAVGLWTAIVSVLLFAPAGRPETPAVATG